jgi:putative transposase
VKRQAPTVSEPARLSAAAATRFFRKLLKGLRYVPRVIVTDKLQR